MVSSEVMDLSSRIRIDLIQKSTTILLVEYSCEAPWLILKWLNVLDLNYEHIARLGCFNLKRSGQVVNLGQVYILHVISAVVVPNLSSSPVDTFNFDNLSVLDRATEGNYLLSAVSGLMIAGSTNCLGAIGSIGD